MICLKSPKSSEFDKTLTNIGQKSFTMFIVSCCNNNLIIFFLNREIKKIISYASAIPGFDATEHLRKENCRNLL